MPGGGELFIIVLIIIMLFGSKKIPELARGLGKGMREIKNATGDIQREISAGVSELNSVKEKVDVEKQVKDMIQDEKQKVSEEKEDQELTSENQKKVTANGQSEKVDEDIISKTVQRRGPYTSKESKNPIEKS